MAKEGPPVGYMVDHASSDFGRYAHRTNLTARQQERFSDYGTAQTVPEQRRFAVGAQYSRGLVDLNRAPDHPQVHPEKDFAKPTPHDVWKPGEALTDREKALVMESVYVPYHREIQDHIRQLGRPGLVVAWHNTAHYTIGANEAGKQQKMVPIILSNRGREGRADALEGETTTCDPALLLELAAKVSHELRREGLPDEVHLNLVYKGGHTTEQYNTFRHPKVNPYHEIQSLQVEYDTLLTHPTQNPRRPDHERMKKLQTAFTRALESVASNIGQTHNF